MGNVKNLHFVEDIVTFILDEAFIRGFEKISVGETIIENYKIFLDNEDTIVLKDSNGYEEKIFLREYEIAEVYEGEGRLLFKDDEGRICLAILIG